VCVTKRELDFRQQSNSGSTRLVCCRIERVEAGLPADKAGLRPGDYVIFVEKFNVVTMPEEEILHVIRSCGNQLTLEIYRRACANGLLGGSTSTTTSLDLSKKRLQLPQVTFSSEVGTGVLV
jgi:C-terminal processing protease CtpA/Prc